MAQTPSYEEKELAPVEVSASRLDVRERDALSSTTVITAQTIRNRQLADLPSILRSEAGIEFDRMGGPGMVTSVFMRGGNANRVLVQLDGVPVSDGSVMGSASILSQLSSDQIDHIEVVRGDVSAIYGSGAAAGVIRIFTRQGAEKPQANIFAEYGSHDTSRMGGNVSGEHKDTRYAFSLSRSNTRGYSSMSASDNSSVNPDSDGYENVTATGSVSHRIGKDTELGARLYLADSSYDYDLGGGPTETDTGKNRQWVGAVYGKSRLAKDWLSTLTLSHMDIDRDYETKNGTSSPSTEYNGMPFPVHNQNGSSYSRTRNSLLQWHNDVALSADVMASAGAEAGYDQTESGRAGINGSWNRNRYSLYGGLAGKSGAHDWQVNVRYDHAQSTDSAMSGYLGYGYRMAPSWKILGNVSASVLMPTLYQQYNPMYGNADLKSERTKGAEAGLQYEGDRMLARLMFFSWFTKDLIDVDASLRYLNVGKARNRGAELTLQSEVATVNVNATLTLQQPEDASTGEVLARRARRLATLNASKTFSRWYAGGTIQYTGDRVDGQHELPAYWLVNLDMRYALTKAVSIYGRVENLFNRDYETVYGYNSPARGIYVGLRLTM